MAGLRIYTDDGDQDGGTLGYYGFTGEPKQREWTKTPSPSCRDPAVVDGDPMARCARPAPPANQQKEHPAARLTERP